MSERALVVRVGELFLKGDNRPTFERALEDNLRRAVADLDGARVERLHGRFLVRASDGDGAIDAIVERVRRVFGVSSVSPALLCDPRVEALRDAAVACARAALDRPPLARRGHPTFRIETRRADKRFPIRSMEVSRRLGAAVVDALGLRVDLTDPDLTVGVEIGAQATFVWTEEIPGPGGLPLGTSGRVLLLLSGGIDSPVAGWLMQKRGCEIDAVYFHSFPYTGDKTREKVTDLGRVLARGQARLALHTVHFTDAQKALREAGRADHAVVLYRRMMMRIACGIARRQAIGALATGENLAQVASQTLENLAVIEGAADRPVLRPLLAYDKAETIALARRIGTYELSILPYDDCCSLFVPKHPATRARLDTVQQAEAALDVAAMAEACAERAEVVALTDTATPPGR